MNGRYNNSMKQCPFCGEAIMASAVKCRFCQEFLDNSSPQTKPCMFCGENLDINATVCDYCGESLVSSDTRQSRPGALQRQTGYKTPSEPVDTNEVQSGFSTYRLPPVGDDFFPYDDQTPVVERCNCCGEQLLSIEDGICPFCGNVFADTMEKKSPSPYGKECPFCGEINNSSSIKCSACGEVMKISPATRGAFPKAPYSDDTRTASSRGPYPDKPGTVRGGVEKSVVTGDLQRECLLCGERNPMNAVKCRVCHEIFDDEKSSSGFSMPTGDMSQDIAQKRGSLLTPSKILSGPSSVPVMDSSPALQSRDTRPFSSRPSSTAGREENYKLCPLCGEKNPLSAAYCKLCCEELKDREHPKAEMPSIAPKETMTLKESVKKSIVTGDLHRECLLCGEKNPVTAVKCRICDEIFDTDDTYRVPQQKKNRRDTEKEDSVPDEIVPPESAEEEKPKPVRKKSHWETAPKQRIEESRVSTPPPPVTKFKEEKKIGIKKSSVEEVKAVACSVCGSKLSPSGDCPDCTHKQTELEKLVKSPDKKTTIYPVLITGVGIIFIIVLLSVIGTYVYPIVRNIVSHPPKPTEVAVVATPDEPTEIPATPVAIESPEVTPDTLMTPTSVPTIAAVPTPVVISKVSFVDINDNFAKDYIIALQRLGIFKDIEGNKFKPYDKITRGQYVRWFVTTADILCPDQEITKSMANLSKNYYDDVQPDYIDFIYIQFLHDRGYIIGIDGTHFEPDKELTREELMMIRCSFEYNIQYTDMRNIDNAKFFPDLQNYFRDPDNINKSYLVSFYKDMATGFPVLNRTFGRIKKLYPRAPVTRSEAAASIGEIMGNSAEKIVEKLLSPTPGTAAPAE